MSAAALAGVTLVIGLVVGALLLRRSATTRADGLFRSWQAEEAKDIGRSAADAARLAAKTDLLGPAFLPALAADGRWLGDPVALVVFDGDAEAKAGALADLRSVDFVSTGEDACPDADVVAECVEAGRVRWVTLRLPAAG